MTLFLFGLARLEEASRIQLGVAIELPRGSMKRVRARLGDDAHLAAGGVAVLGGEVVGLNAHFLDGIRRRGIEAGRLIEVREHRAVQREEIVVRIAAVDRHDRALTAIGGVLVRADGGDARVGAGQRDDVAAVHGQILDALIVDQVRLRRVARLDDAGAAGDDDFFSEAADAEREIETDVGAGGDLDVLLHLGLEPGQLDFDLIGAARQRLQIEEAGGVGRGGPGQLLPGGLGGHRCAGYCGACRVMDVPTDGACDLSLERCGTQEHRQAQQQSA